MYSKYSNQFSDLRIHFLIIIFSLFAAKRGGQGSSANKDFSIQLDLGDNVDLAPGGFYG